MTGDADRPWFSPLLNRIAEIAGVRAALLLGAEKGCQRVYIPREARPHHWLSKLVGLEPAALLAAEFGGSELEIPPAVIGQTRRRRAAIAEMSAKGYSINKTAQAAGVARSTVKLHRRRLKGDEDQGTLL